MLSDIGDSGDVVRPKHVHDQLKSPSEFLPMVRNIRQPVRRLARAFHDDLVFLCAELRGAEPDCSLLIVREAFCAKLVGFDVECD